MKKRETWSFYSGNELSFGRGAIAHLERFASSKRIGRPLIVTDPKIVQLGLVDVIVEPLEKAGCQCVVFDQSTVEPSTTQGLAATTLGRDSHVDAVIGLGGGSNMDLAKLVAVLLGCDADPESLFGFDQVRERSVPLACVPTTAGTGSEVSHAAIIKHADSGKKDAILSQCLRPDVAIVDPSLTDTCPPRLTAESGIDALTHAIESYLATSSDQFEESLPSGLPYEGQNDFADMFAKRAIVLIGGNLATAFECASESSREEAHAARDAMSLAATYAGIAFSSSGVTLAHALEYWIGMNYDCSHGVGNALVLPEVMRFYLPTRAERLGQIATLLNGDVAGSESAEDAIRMVEALRAKLQLPTRLRDVGAQEGDLERIAGSAFKLTRLMELTPRETSPGALAELLRSCW